MICVETEMAALCILNNESCVVVAKQLHCITLSLSAVGTRKKGVLCCLRYFNCFVECWILPSTLQAKCVLFSAMWIWGSVCGTEKILSWASGIASHVLFHWLQPGAFLLLGLVEFFLVDQLCHRIQLYMWWTGGPLVDAAWFSLTCFLAVYRPGALKAVMTDEWS